MEPRRDIEVGDASPAGLTVPVELLAHALRTPLNAIAGYGRLLATGACGTLDAEGRRAVEAIGAAIGVLERTVGLLESTPAPLFQGDACVDGTAELAHAFEAQGWAQTASADFAWHVVPWAGWTPLLGSLAAALMGDGLKGIRLVASDGWLAVEHPLQQTGSGDGALARCLAHQRAEAAGLGVVDAAGRGLKLVGPGFMTGRGTLDLHNVRLNRPGRPAG